MDIRQNPLWLSIPLGRYFRTEVRLSLWYFLIVLTAWVRLGWQLGLVVSGILFVSILIHEFAHVFAARRTGGSGHEILLWPLGGLAMVTPAPNFYSEFWTILCGPISNLVICLLTLPVVATGHHLSACLSFLTLPHVDLRGEPWQALVLLTFSLNFKLLVLNLLPIYPLDGGQLTFNAAKLKWDRQTARVGTLWVGMFLCIVLVCAGLQLKSTDLIFLGSVLMMYGTYEHLASQITRPYDDSFMGYDFSQGYTSLEGELDRDQAPRPGLLARWRQQRAERKQERELHQRLETERRVDELLAKVHQTGMSSLTEAERRFLQRASGRYRSPGKE